MQKLGQHFLIDGSALQRIANKGFLKEPKAVIEIGPGHGELTAKLASLAKESGAKLYAIERDTALYEALIQNPLFSDVIIIPGNALEELPLLLEKIPEKIFTIVGNIPYYITGKLLRIIGESPKKPTRTVLTIQKEVAERLVAEPPHMNRLAASVQWWAKPTIEMVLSKEKFNPPPKIDSAVICLETKSEDKQIKELDERYYKAVRALFAQPRKTVLNNVVAGIPSLNKVTAQNALEEKGVLPSSRPQDLSILDIENISELFK